MPDALRADLGIPFLSLTTNPAIIGRIIAAGLAFGIVFDAVTVRSLVVPPLVAIMGAGTGGCRPVLLGYSACRGAASDTSRLLWAQIRAGLG